MTLQNNIISSSLVMVLAAVSCLPTTQGVEPNFQVGEYVLYNGEVSWVNPGTWCTWALQCLPWNGKAFGKLVKIVKVNKDTPVTYKIERIEKSDIKVGLVPECKFLTLNVKDVNKYANGSTCIPLEKIEGTETRYRACSKGQRFQWAIGHAVEFYDSGDNEWIVGYIAGTNVHNTTGEEMLKVVYNVTWDAVAKKYIGTGIDQEIEIGRYNVKGVAPLRTHLPKACTDLQARMTPKACADLQDRAQKVVKALYPERFGPEANAEESESEAGETPEPADAVTTSDSRRAREEETGSNLTIILLCVGAVVVLVIVLIAICMCGQTEDEPLYDVDDIEAQPVPHPIRPHGHHHGHHGHHHEHHGHHHGH